MASHDDVTRLVAEAGEDTAVAFLDRGPNGLELGACEPKAPAKESLDLWTIEQRTVVHVLHLDEPGHVDITPWADRLRLVDARFTGSWELPVLGAVTPPTAALIRPDGYVAWVGQGGDLGLNDALTSWFGPGLGMTGTRRVDRWRERDP